MAIRTNTRLGGTRYTVWPLGSDLVTDGGFAAVTAGAELITNGDMETAVAVLYGAQDSVGNGTYVQSAAKAHGGTKSGLVTKTGGGSFGPNFIDTIEAIVPNELGTYFIDVWVYVPSGQTVNTVLVSVFDGINPESTLDSTITKDSWVQLSGYAHYAGARFQIQIRGNEGDVDDFFYLDDLSIKNITLTNWTAGTGWTLEAVAGALTGKALKTAGTASALERDVSAVASHPYQVVYTNDQSTTGKSINSEVGGVNGATVTADATTTDEIFTTSTGNLKIEAAADWAGKIGPIACKKRG